MGLLDPATLGHIDPVSLVTAHKIDIAIWELHDMTVRVVRSTKFPANRASFPDNRKMLAARCAEASCVGHFASVAMAGAAQSFTLSDSKTAVPLSRGLAIDVNFERPE